MNNCTDTQAAAYQPNYFRIMEESTLDETKISTESLVVFFLFGGLMIAGFVREINKKTSIPYTPMLFVIGIFLGKFSESMGILGITISKISLINPHGILIIFLPVLIFESGFNSDWHTFKKQSGQIFLLAFPCVLFSAIFLLISIKVILRYDDSYYTWSGAFMFGSILSCTDTVAVLALLKEVGAPKKFNSLIEGESLLNDGTCMVLFQISSEFAKKVDQNTQNQQYFDLIEVIKLLLSLTVGGTLLGIVFGMVAQFWMRRIHNDPILTVNITFIVCYLTYYVAENVDIGIKVSGIMALVSLGIYLSIFGKTKISSEEKRTVYIFWKYVTYAGESIIFILAGVLVGVKVLTSNGDYDTMSGSDNVSSSIKTSDYFKLFGLYVCMILSRFGSIACFMSWLRKWGYGLTWKEVYVLAYGGLRGAIGISFAMIVANDDSYSQKLRDIILFDMAGNAILTLIINGTTTGPLIKSLGLCVTSTVRERVFLNILQDLKEDTEKKINYLKSNNYLKMVNWESVREYVGLADLEQRITRLGSDLTKREEIEEYTRNIRNKNVIDAKIDELKNSNEFQEQQSFDSDSTNHNLDENMIVECRNRFLMALKGNYWDIYERNQCSSNALLLLIDSVNWDLDTEQERMNSWEFLSNYFYNPIYIKVLFQLKGWPIIGSYAGNLLFNHISNIYDVIAAYIEAHEQAEQLCIEQFPFIPQVLEIIIRESQDNRMSGEEYIKNDLNVSFPEITKQIQTKKATYSLLECQKKIIRKGILLGKIDEKERDILMQQIDDRVVALDNIKPSWKAPPIKNFLENVPFFKLIHKDLLPYIIKESIEMIFEKDMYIIKEGEKAKYFFVITRGSATETTSQSFCTYQEQKEVGSLISPHHLIVPSLRYLTSCMANAVVYVLAFPLSSIQKVIKVNFEIKEYVWMQSLRALSQLFYNELKPLGSLDRNSFIKLQPKLKFAKYNKGKTIQCESGGILLKGQVSRKDLTDVMMTQSRVNNDEVKKSDLIEGRIYKAFCVLMPGQAFSVYTEKKCTFLHFAEDCEEIRFMMSHIDYNVGINQQTPHTLNIFSPVAVSGGHNKRNSFQAPHLSRFAGRYTFNNLEVVVQGSDNKLSSGQQIELQKMKSKQYLNEQKIKIIKSDDDEESDDNKDKLADFAYYMQIQNQKSQQSIQVH